MKLYLYPSPLQMVLLVVIHIIHNNCLIGLEGCDKILYAKRGDKDPFIFFAETVLVELYKLN